LRGPTLIVERGHLDVQLATIARTEAHVDPLGVLRRRSVHATSCAVRVPNSGVPIHGVAHCWRASLVHATRSPQAVLPLREERVLPAGQQRDRRAALGGRGVVPEELRQPAGIETVEHLGARRRDRLERLLDDLLSGGADRLAQEDVRDRGRVGRVVVATARLLGQLPEDPRRTAARSDRRERDPGRPLSANRSS
jgi:hypothetical protein